MKKISRRELGALAASMAAAQSVVAQAQVSGATYTGPLTGVTNGLEGRKLDPVAYTVDRYAAAPRRLRFQAGSRADAERWQTTLRNKLTELLGGRSPDRLIAMCGSGVTAAHLLLAMDVAGLSGGRLYAGSWSEWIRDPTRPIRTGAEP